MFSNASVTNVTGSSQRGEPREAPRSPRPALYRRGSALVTARPTFPNAGPVLTSFPEVIGHWTKRPSQKSICRILRWNSVTPTELAASSTLSPGTDRYISRIRMEMRLGVSTVLRQDAYTATWRGSRSYSPPVDCRRSGCLDVDVRTSRYEPSFYLSGQSVTALA